MVGRCEILVLALKEAGSDYSDTTHLLFDVYILRNGTLYLIGPPSRSSSLPGCCLNGLMDTIARYHTRQQILSQHIVPACCLKGVALATTSRICAVIRSLCP